MLLKQIPNRVSDLLPDYAHRNELGGIPGLQGLILSQLTSNELSWINAQIWQQAGQVALRNMIASVGIPSGPMATSVVSVLGAFNPQLSTAQRLEQISGSLVNGIIALSEPILEEAIDAGIGVAMDIVSAVPFVGWVAQIFWSFGKIAYNAKHSDPYDVVEKYDPSVFSPSIDNMVLNSVLLQLDSNDWSTLFYPPSLGKNESWKQPISVTDLTDGGKRFVGTNQAADPCTTEIPFCLGGTQIPASSGLASGGLIVDPWLGLVPGTTWLHRAIETTGKHEIHEVGATLLPSAQKQAGWLWKHVGHTNSPAAFTVNCDRAENFWQIYIEDLRQAIRASSLNSEMKAKIFKAYDRQLVKGKWNTIFGWGDGSKEVEYATGPILRTLRQRQLHFCDTLTVAYVDKTFGGAADPVVLAKINKRQQDLLANPAVCDVDLSNVQDVLLHDEIIERRKGYQCIVAGTDALATPSGPAGPKPPDLQDGFATPDPAGLDPGRRVWPRYVAGGVAVAGLTGLGIVCRKDLHRAIRNLRLRIPI